jgi:hypothetical protein
MTDSFRSTNNCNYAATDNVSCTASCNETLQAWKASKLARTSRHTMHVMRDVLECLLLHCEYPSTVEEKCILRQIWFLDKWNGHNFECSQY